MSSDEFREEGESSRSDTLRENGPGRQVLKVGYVFKMSEPRVRSRREKEKGRGREKGKVGRNEGKDQLALILLGKEYSHARIGLICLLGVTTVTAAIVYSRQRLRESGAALNGNDSRSWEWSRLRLGVGEVDVKDYR